MLRCIRRFDFIEAFYLPFNFATQAAAIALLPAAKQKGVGVMVIKPFMKGSLFTLPRFAPEVAGLKRKQDESLALANLRFILSNEAVTSVIPGTETVEELTINARGVEGQAGTGAERRSLERAAEYAANHPLPGYEWLAEKWRAPA